VAEPPSNLITFEEPQPSPDDRLIRITFDPVSKRWGFYTSHPLDRREAEYEELLGVQYPYNTVEAATSGAVQSLEPYWDAGTTLWIHGGVKVPNVPANVHFTGSPGYRAFIDAGLYEIDQEQLRAVHAQTKAQIDALARETAIRLEIPIGQQVHAFSLLWDKMPRRSRPKRNDYLDQMMPRVAKRTRERHVKAFLIVASEDWPAIVRTTEVKITGLVSILKAARIYSPPPPRRKKTPMKQRYLELRGLVYLRRYKEARRLVLRFDEEDADAPEGSFSDQDSE
jgi:hypothetical protein